jgi:hypothetical protein
MLLLKTFEVQDVHALNGKIMSEIGLNLFGEREEPTQRDLHGA